MVLFPKITLPILESHLSYCIVLMARMIDKDTNDVVQNVSGIFKLLRT